MTMHTEKTSTGEEKKTPLKVKADEVEMRGADEAGAEESKLLISSKPAADVDKEMSAADKRKPKAKLTADTVELGKKDSSKDETEKLTLKVDQACRAGRRPCSPGSALLTARPP